MKRGMMLVMGFSVGTALAVAAVAQPVDPIAARQALMKQNGKDTKMAFGMIKGAVPFDAGVAATILANVSAAAAKFGNYFPATSQTGGDTEAAPAIWTKPDAFKAAVVKFQSDSAAARDAKPATLDAFKAAFLPVTQNCKSCHEAFKIEK
jgi:cytochrome c556